MSEPAWATEELAWPEGGFQGRKLGQGMAIQGCPGVGGRPFLGGCSPLPQSLLPTGHLPQHQSCGLLPGEFPSAKPPMSLIPSSSATPPLRTSGTAHLPPSPPGWHHYSPKGPGLTKAKALPRPTLGWRICSEQRGSF